MWRVVKLWPHPHHQTLRTRVKSERNCLEEYEGKVGVVEALKGHEKEKEKSRNFPRNKCTSILTETIRPWSHPSAHPYNIQLMCSLYLYAGSRSNLPVASS